MFAFDDSKKVYLFDGAMGTELYKRGLLPGARPDLMNIDSPEAVFEVHSQYVAAGSDIICTNTFGANADALKGTGRSPGEVISAAVGVAKKAAAGRAFVALDIGPLGKLLDPIGDLAEEAAYELFREQAVAGEKAGADLAAIETMSSLEELSLAIRAVRENTKLAVFATMTFNEGGRTYLGVTPEDFAKTAEALGVIALGVNCSLGPDKLYPIVERISAATSLPLIVKPNAGLPDAGGNYDITPQVFSGQMLPYRTLGVRVVGGCCGTSPEYIKTLTGVYR